MPEYLEQISDKSIHCDKWSEIFFKLGNINRKFGQTLHTVRKTAFFLRIQFLQQNIEFMQKNLPLEQIKSKCLPFAPKVFILFDDLRCENSNFIRFKMNFHA